MYRMMLVQLNSWKLYNIQQDRMSQDVGKNNFGHAAHWFVYQSASIDCEWQLAETLILGKLTCKNASPCWLCYYVAVCFSKHLWLLCWWFWWMFWFISCIFELFWSNQKRNTMQKQTNKTKTKTFFFLRISYIFRTTLICVWTLAFV